MSQSYVVPQQPAYQAPYQPTSQAPAPRPKKAPVWGFLTAIGSIGLGAMAFLIIGFQGNRAPKELILGMIAIAAFMTLLTFIGSLIAFVRKGYIVGIVTSFLAVTGVVIGIFGMVMHEIHMEKVRSRYNYRTSSVVTVPAQTVQLT